MEALPSRLLEIPAEIRITIYKILFANATISVKESPQSVILLNARDSCLLTCRTIRREARPYFCSAKRLLVSYDSGFVVPDWTETAYPEPADWNRSHIRDWTRFPSLISSTYLSGVESAVIYCDKTSFSSFILNLHNLPKLEYLEIRSLMLQSDGAAEEDFPDWDSLISVPGQRIVESRANPYEYLYQLEDFFFKSSRYFKARVIFPVKVNRLHTVVCCESFLI